MVVGRVPIRTCVGCRRTSDKQTLTRIVRGPTGEVRIDPTGKAPGRGAYLCGAKECLKQAVKGKRLARALRCEITAGVIGNLEEWFAGSAASEEHARNGDVGYER